MTQFTGAIREAIDWTQYASMTLDDGALNLPQHCDHGFPGYIAKPGHPFMPQNPLTHPAHDTHPLIGRYSYGDSPEAFDKNLKIKGPDWHYATKIVEYHCNADGYRAPEWSDIDWANSIVMLGCSMTFGIGVAQDETLCYFLEQLTGRPVINLGYPSGTNDLILNNAASLANNFPAPWSVIINWSTLDRFMFYSEYPSTLGLWTDKRANVDGVQLQKLYKLKNFSEKNVHIEAYYWGSIARAIWSHRTRYVTGSYYARSVHYTRSDLYFQQDNGGRDLVHPGPRAHQAAAQKIHEFLKTK